jgi:hypothetical protein
MPETLASLHTALASLHGAVQANLRDNAFYMAANAVSDLAAMAGYAANGVRANGTTDLATALDNVRRHADRALHDNRYYAFSHKLDALAFVAARHTPPTEPKAPPPVTSMSGLEAAQVLKPEAVQTAAEASGAANIRTFDDLAAASEARVAAVKAQLEREQVRASAFAAQPETANDGELERRSSREGSGTRNGTRGVAALDATGLRSKAEAETDRVTGSPPQTRLSTAPFGNRARPAASDTPAPSAPPGASFPHCATGHDRKAGAARQAMTGASPQAPGLLDRLLGR